MAGKGQLSPRREDPQAIISPLVGRRTDERRFGQVGPGRDRLHLSARQRVAIEHDSDGIALNRDGGEHVHLLEAERFHLKHPSSRYSSASWDSGLWTNALCRYGKGRHAQVTRRIDRNATESSHRPLGWAQCHHSEHPSPGHLKQGESKIRTARSNKPRRFAGALRRVAPATVGGT